MRKITLSFTLFVAFLLIVSCGNSQAVQSSQEAKTSLNASVQQAEVEELLNYLSSNELKGRQTGTEGIELAAQKIESIFQKNDIQKYFDSYRHNFETNGVKGFNVVGVLEGNDPRLKDEFIILGAHYDHIGIQKPVEGDSIANGANDNAAGTVAVVELAKMLAEMDNNKRSIMFVLFSAEEMGLVGAKRIAQRLKEDRLDLYALFNFEMIGVPMNDKEYIGYLTGYENSNFAEKFNEYSGEKVLGFLPQAKEYNLFKRSDNYPFFEEFNVPAQTISTFDFTNYDYYHHVADEAEKLDVAHMTNVIESVIPGILKMANTPEKEIKLNQHDAGR
ncbi:M20/M25/M40 family metallo-hydrolase [Salegentibacter salegens]|uniref:Peptidase family M28 n=1 Tax=Salegentibacter salegens TaxID=143223 RepID=A0A1M7HSG0_9FLAO|nr:M20/M25/M40 family metallo-hydrolase [Salegentibacter salegens]PRX43191.1 peptidase M28-like protein [Salegentibacter salegens]SHM31491.1 Peptidase family M28 [Salegentibacter salegens]